MKQAGVGAKTSKPFKADRDVGYISRGPIRLRRV